jgi:hypothetical protein
MKDTKKQLLSLCKATIEQRIESYRQAIADAQRSANEETKSSSGDKYETGRAMAQLEIEKSSLQLSESIKLRDSLDQISIDQPFASVLPGSLVVTDHGTFFIAIGLGKIELNNKPYFVIAPFSPLALAMAGARVGERVPFRDQVYLIQELI